MRAQGGEEARGPERRSVSGPVQATTCSTLADARRRQEHCWSIQPVRAIPITGRTLRDGPCGVNGAAAGLAGGCDGQANAPGVVSPGARAVGLLQDDRYVGLA